MTMFKQLMENPRFMEFLESSSVAHQVQVSFDMPRGTFACLGVLVMQSIFNPLMFQNAVAEGSTEHLRWSRGGGSVHRLAAIDPSATVEVGAVIHEHAQVGPHSHIGSGSVVGPRVTIGSHSTLWYNVSLQNSCVGDHCTIHSGVCIGQDGFGFLVDDQGNMIKKPQMLQVNVGDNVEIGANSCIDRGSWRNTVIGDHTKIDNQVQIGHNVIIGRSCMICGQVGLGGSSTIGDFVVLGGKCGVADHISIASKVRIAAKGGVTRNITQPGDYAGFPVVPAAEWRRSMARFCKLGQAKLILD
ncbi:hypothetical protein L7F22_020043 [Adiantum nelumboides]|nr:hypothetical protein [Adiantum nelumboides]